MEDGELIPLTSGCSPEIGMLLGVQNPNAIVRDMFLDVASRLRTDVLTLRYTLGQS